MYSLYVRFLTAEIYKTKREKKTKRERNISEINKSISQRL